MLNETLKEMQSGKIEIHDCAAGVGNTGLPGTDSANLGARRLARTRIQRMRRRQQRSASFARSSGGWVARML